METGVMTARHTGWTRFVIIAVLLGSTAIFLRARSGREPAPTRQSLSGFPLQIGEWIGREVGIDPSVREVLGEGEFVSRFYIDQHDAAVDLFIGYFPSQRTGNTIHSPRNCLPGAGWSPLYSSSVQLRAPGGRSLKVNSYVIGKGLDRQVVLYWYQAHDRVVASEYWAKFYLVADAVRTNRTDGALVRIVAPVRDSEHVEQAQDRAIAFAEQVLPRLDAYIPK
jgi:EpsI family protein